MAQALNVKELIQGLYQGHISNHYLVPLNLRKTDDLPELGPPKTSLRRNIPPASPKQLQMLAPHQLKRQLVNQVPKRFLFKIKI